MTFKVNNKALAIAAAVVGTAAALYLANRLFNSKSSSEKKAGCGKCCGGNGKKQVVFVLGGPGAGKGTQCEKIIAAFPSFKFFSAGDLLRAERASGSETAKLINDKIASGQIVPARITVELLMKAMDTCPPGSKFLIDGFPRNLDNVTVWNEILGDDCTVEFVLFLECAEDIMIGRVLERSKTSGRTDDNIETLRKRFKTYQDETSPIIEMYKKQGLVKTIPADRPVEVVYRDVEALIKSIP